MTEIQNFNLDKNNDLKVDSNELNTLKTTLDWLTLEEKQDFIWKLEKSLSKNEPLKQSLKSIFEANKEDKDLWEIYEALFWNEGKEESDNLSENTQENLLYKNLTKEQKEELKKLWINEKDYDECIENFKFDSFNKFSKFISSLWNLELLYQIWKNSIEFDNNFYLLEENFWWKNIVENIKECYKSWINVSNIIKNINISKKNNIELSAQDLFDLWNKIIDKQSIEYFKINNQLSIKDIKMFDLYWVSKEELKNLMETKKEVFDFFENIDIDKHYVVELAKIGFNPKDFKWYEKIFTGRTIADIVALFNRKNNVSNEDIKFYFTFFEGKLENHENYDYIEKIDNLISGNVENLKEKYKAKKLVETYNELYNTNYEEKIKKQAENYKKELWEKWDYLKLEDIKTYLIWNDIKIENIKPFLEFKFDAEGLLFLWSNHLWINYPEIDKEGKLKIVKSIIAKWKEINKKFSWKDIMNLIYKWKEELKNNLDSNIDKYLWINSEFTWPDIYNLNEVFTNLDKKEISNIIKKYEKTFWKLNWWQISIIYQFEQKWWDINKLKKFKENLSDFNFKESSELILKDIKINDIKEIYDNFKETINKNTIFDILVNWITYEKYDKFAKNNEKNDFQKNLNIIDYTQLKINWLSEKHIDILTENYLEKVKFNWEVAIEEYKSNLLELSEMKNIWSLVDFLEDNKDLKIKIWKQEFKIHWNLQFLRQILTNINKNFEIPEWKKINWKELIKDTWEILNWFIETNKTIDRVFFLSSNHYYWEDYGNRQYNNKNRIKSIYKWAEFVDFTTWTKEWNKLEKSNEIITILEKTLEKNPKENLVLYINLHWAIDWSALTSKWWLTKKDFLKINEISGKYKNLKIVINSCNSWYKFEWKEIKWNIEINSGKYTSLTTYGDFLEKAMEKGNDGFQKWDLNKDWKLTEREARMYQTIKYQYSGITNNEFNSFYRDKNWNKKYIDKYILNTK